MCSEVAVLNVIGTGLRNWHYVLWLKKHRQILVLEN